MQFRISLVEIVVKIVVKIVVEICSQSCCENRLPYYLIQWLSAVAERKHKPYYLVHWYYLLRQLVRYFRFAFISADRALSPSPDGSFLPEPLPLPRKFDRGSASISPLTDSNYSAWKKAIRILFMKVGVQSVIDDVQACGIPPHSCIISLHSCIIITLLFRP